ncbi:MAG: carboxypeptidase-like regulatory domain-containing protein [Bacteroidia bacterium]|jgi:hypothetical protein
MKALRVFTFILFGSLWMVSCAQTILPKTKFAYVIFTYLNPEQRPILIENRITGELDTVLSFIYGKIVDSIDRPLPLAQVEIKTASLPQDSFVVQTDENGEYKIYIKPGWYNLTVFRTTPFFLNHIHLESGQRRELNVKLRGMSPLGYITTNLQSEKTLSAKKLYQREKKLAKSYKYLIETR